MYKRLFKIVFVHILIIIYWGFLYSTGNIVKESTVLNAVSITLLMTLNFLIYTEISNRKIPLEASTIFTLVSLIPLALLLRESTRYKTALGLISIISTGIYTKKFMNYGNIQAISILPISKSSTVIFTVLLLVLSSIIIYLFDINSLMINLLYNLIFLVMESFFILFLKEKEDTYEKTYRLYYLSDYIASEKDEFARIIHDDIVQDIFASRNYLSLKNPDIEYTKDILTNLEKRLRDLMKFYQSSLFEKSSIETSIASIFDNVSSLYLNKSIRIEKMIDSEIVKDNDRQLVRLISIITKELINNIYKHSDGTYLIYRLYKKEKQAIIEIESDGTSSEDFININESKKGILLLRLLLDTNSGNISYKLNKDILHTKVTIEVGSNENSITR